MTKDVKKDPQVGYAKPVGMATTHGENATQAENDPAYGQVSRWTAGVNKDTTWIMQTVEKLGAWISQSE